MKPFREIISRIRYTDSLDEWAFTVGYADRMAESGVKEISLGAFLSLGEVPEHRVKWIKDAQGIVVWDKEKKICLL